jgi:hypothetical protein
VPRHHVRNLAVALPGDAKGLDALTKVRRASGSTALLGTACALAPLSLWRS